MLSKTISITKKEKKDYPPIPEDVYQVELLDITSKETDNYERTGKETVLDFQFTLLEGVNADLSKLRGRNLWRNFVPTYLYEGKNGKNALYQITEAALGRNLTIEEEARMDGEFLNTLIGKQLRVVVQNTTKDGKTYSNIKSFLPKRDNLPGLTAEEKEVAMVKKKDQDGASESKMGELPEINIDEIGQ